MNWWIDIQPKIFNAIYLFIFLQHICFYAIVLMEQRVRALFISQDHLGEQLMISITFLQRRLQVGYHKETTEVDVTVIHSQSVPGGQVETAAVEPVS